jgi:hypothetical protein
MAGDLRGAVRYGAGDGHTTATTSNSDIGRSSTRPPSPPPSRRIPRSPDLPNEGVVARRAPRYRDEPQPRSRLRLRQVGTCIPGDSRISRNLPSQRARRWDRLIPGNGSQRRGPRLQHRKQGRHSRELRHSADGAPLGHDQQQILSPLAAQSRPFPDPYPPEAPLGDLALPRLSSPQWRGTCSAEAESPRRAG